MYLLEQLSRGDLGVRFALPGGFVIKEDSRKHLMSISREKASAIWGFYSEDPFDLNPAHWSILRQDLERAARDIFISTGKQMPREGPLERLRTDDPSWSPLVDVTPISLNGGEALVVLHRTLYEPEKESLMGHILIPVRNGMVELRTATTTDHTGFRESVVSEIRMKENPTQPGEEVAAYMRRITSQKDFDDPGLDVEFPEHPLSRARQILRELQEQIVVTRPPQKPPDEIVSKCLRCAFVTPPRYLLRADGGTRIQLTKMSIATTDGISYLTLIYMGGALWPFSDLKDLIAKSCRGMPPQGSTEVKYTPRSERDAPNNAEGLLTFIRDDGFPGQTAIRAFQDDERSVWLLTIGTGRSSPSEELFRDLDGLVRSFRRLAAPKRAWYQFWKR
jgi:hypothetical protein